MAVGVAQVEEHLPPIGPGKDPASPAPVDPAIGDVAQLDVVQLLDVLHHSRRAEPPPKMADIASPADEGWVWRKRRPKVEVALARPWITEPVRWAISSATVPVQIAPPLRRPEADTGPLGQRARTAELLQPVEVDRALRADRTGPTLRAKACPIQGRRDLAGVVGGDDDLGALGAHVGPKGPARRELADAGRALQPGEAQGAVGHRKIRQFSVESGDEDQAGRPGVGRNP